MSCWPHDVLDRFKARPVYRSRTWKAVCPAHDDRTPSLRLWIGRKGSLIVRCWANCRCPVEAIVSAVGLTMSDLFPPEDRTDGPHSRPGRAPKVWRKEVCTYDYEDEFGEILYQTVRFEPKEFSYRRPLPEGGWAWNLLGVRLVLYRLSDIWLNPDRAVIVVEGEKDAGTLAHLGLIATTNCGGTGMGWCDNYSRMLVARRVVVIPDNDDPGRKHSTLVAGSLMMHGAASVRLAQLPDLAERGDVTDWLAAGRTRTDLLDLIRAVPEWRCSR